MGYTEEFEAHRRRVILELMARQSDLKLSNIVLHRALITIGIGLSMDALDETLEVLAKDGLVTLAVPIKTMTVATLTRAGADVVEGVKTVSGIARKLPAM